MANITTKGVLAEIKNRAKKVKQNIGALKDIGGNYAHVYGNYMNRREMNTALKNKRKNKKKYGIKMGLH